MPREKSILTCYADKSLKERLLLYCDQEDRTQSSAIAHFIKVGIERADAQAAAAAAEPQRRNLIK